MDFEITFGSVFSTAEEIVSHNIKDNSCFT